MYSVTLTVEVSRIGLDNVEDYSAININLSNLFVVYTS